MVSGFDRVVFRGTLRAIRYAEGMQLKGKVTASRVLGLLQVFLTAKVMETAEGSTPEEGTPQGAVVTPLAASPSSTGGSSAPPRRFRRFHHRRFQPHPNHLQDRPSAIRPSADGQAGLQLVVGNRIEISLGPDDVGFIQLPKTPKRLFLPMATFAKLFS